VRTKDRCLNLCDFCLNNFPTCEPKVIGFGEGKGSDNVVECDIWVSDGTPEAVAIVKEAYPDFEIRGRNSISRC
jgi:hypothetical protein